MSDLTPELVMELTKDRRVKAWAKEDGFLEWLQNKNEFRQRLERLIDVGLDTAMDILTNPEEKGASKVNLLKILLEVGNRFPSKTQVVKFADSSIDRMTPEQLDGFLARSGYIKAAEPKLLLKEKEPENEE
jgi:hypothetical protein